MTGETHDTGTIDDGPAVADAPPRPTFSRRRLFAGGGILAATAVIAACGDDDDDDAATATTAGGSTASTAATGDTSAETTMTTGGAGATTTTAAEGGGDLAIAMVAASLEVLAVSTYQAALDAATSGALGDVPPAVATFVTTALAHHQAHLDAWNGALTDAGETEVTDPPADLAATVQEAFGEITDVVGAAELALMLEGIASATYLSVLPVLTDPGAIALAASIQPIDRQHEAVLLFVLGQYPVPDTFAPVDMAYSG